LDKDPGGDVAPEPHRAIDAHWLVFRQLGKPFPEFFKRDVDGTGRFVKRVFLWCPNINDNGTTFSQLPQLFPMDGGCVVSVDAAVIPKTLTIAVPNVPLYFTLRP